MYLNVAKWIVTSDAGISFSVFFYESHKLFLKKITNTGDIWEWTYYPLIDLDIPKNDD